MHAHDTIDIQSTIRRIRKSNLWFGRACRTGDGGALTEPEPNFSPARELASGYLGRVPGGVTPRHSNTSTYW